MSNKLQVINKLTGRVMYAGYDARSARVAAGGDWAMIILRDGLICDKRTCKPSLRTLKDAAERAAVKQGIYAITEARLAQVPFSMIEGREVQTGFVGMTQEAFAPAPVLSAAAIAVQAAGAVFTANRDRVPFTHLSTRRVHVGPDQFAQSVFAYLQGFVDGIRAELTRARKFRMLARETERDGLQACATYFRSMKRSAQHSALMLRRSMREQFAVIGGIETLIRR